MTTHPTPLTTTELRAWRPNLLSWTIIHRLLDRQLQRDAGLPHAYYAVLVALTERRGEPVPLTRLARILDYSQSRLSHAIARMEKAGLVERAVDDGDRRVSGLLITREGARVYSRASVGHVAEIRRVFLDHLDDRDLADLDRIGGKLLDGLAPLAGETSEFGRAARP